MATYDNVQGSAVFPDTKRPLCIFERLLDCDTNNQAAGVIVDMIDIPANTFVLAVFAEIETAEGGTLTFDVGDSNAGDNYLNGANGNVTAGTRICGDGSTGSAALTASMTAIVSKHYTSADTITLTVVNAADTAKIRLKVLAQNIADV